MSLRDFPLGIFNSKLFLLACHKKFFDQKSVFVLFCFVFLFCHFLKKSSFLVKFDIKMDSLTHFHSRNVYFHIHYSNKLKVTALDMFQKMFGPHLP